MVNLLCDNSGGVKRYCGAVVIVVVDDDDDHDDHDHDHDQIWIIISLELSSYMYEIVYSLSHPKSLVKFCKFTYSQGSITPEIPFRRSSSGVHICILSNPRFEPGLSSFEASMFTIMLVQITLDLWNCFIWWFIHTLFWFPWQPNIRLY